MTATEAPVAIPALPALNDSVERCLRMLGDAADAADRLGIDTHVVRTAHADAMRRIGFPGEAYVLALVGGTGVGKSSLLNALAGEAVSVASVRRPTTSRPVAWLPAAVRVALAPFLEWLGVDDVREHRGHGLGPVAILDLPDMDSVEVEHRARVESILPRVDAVMWVTDPEKYHDAVLHDGFLRTWLPRLARQVVVVNKTDRLAPDDARRVRSDLELDLARSDGRDTGHPVPVLLTSAAPPGDPRTGESAQRLDDVRRWLSDGVAAKSIVRARLAATAVELAHGLAREAGIDPARPFRPYLDATSRSAAVEDAATAVLRTVDLRGRERQAEAATRAGARARGAGPLGRVTSLIYRASGQETRDADPEAYLIRWRDRGTLTAAVETIRSGLAGSIRSATPTLRPIVAAALEPVEVRHGLERAIDRAVAGLRPLDPPTSRWWSVIGLLQTLATAGIVLSVVWLAITLLGAPAASTVRLPLLGAVPSPLATLIVFLIAGYLLARGLGWHAGWVGRRWAHDVRDRVGEAVRSEVGQRALRPIDTIEGSRERLWTATSALDRTCGRRSPV